MWTGRGRTGETLGEDGRGVGCWEGTVLLLSPRHPGSLQGLECRLVSGLASRRDFQVRVVNDSHLLHTRGEVGEGSYDHVSETSLCKSIWTTLGSPKTRDVHLSRRRESTWVPSRSWGPKLPTLPVSQSGEVESESDRPPNDS